MKSHFLPLLSLILLSPFHLSASDNHQGIYDSESEDDLLRINILSNTYPNDQTTNKSSDDSGYFVTDNNNPNDMQNQHEDEPSDNNNPNDMESDMQNEDEDKSSDENTTLNLPTYYTNTENASGILLSCNGMIFFTEDYINRIEAEDSKVPPSPQDPEDLYNNSMSPHDLNESPISLNPSSQSSRPQDSEPSQSRSNIQEKPEGLDMTIIRFFSNKIQYYMNKNFFGILKKFVREEKRLQNIIKPHQQALQPIFTNPFGDNNIVTSIEFSPYNTSSKTSSTNKKPPSITKNIPFLMLVFTTHKIVALKL